MDPLAFNGIAYRCAVAYVIKKEDQSFLQVQRPENDESLPNVWGLPAGNVHNCETFQEAVLRSGKEKLGVSLEIVKFIGRGNTCRKDYILHLEEFEVKIIDGNPSVPQKVSGVTQYQKIRWGLRDDLKDAASKGSLCSQIYLVTHPN